MIQNGLSEVFMVYKVAATLFVRSAGVERSFSSMKYLKNRLRSTMSEDRLEALMLMYIQADVDVDLDMVIDEFKASCLRGLSSKESTFF